MAVPDIGGTWSSQDSKAIAGMYSEEGVRHVIAGDVVCRGRDEIAANAQGLIDVLDGEKVEVRKVSEGSNGTVVVEWVLLGTHTKDAPGWPAKNEALNLPHGSLVGGPGRRRPARGGRSPRQTG